MTQPTAAAIRAAKKWRDLDMNGPIRQPGSPTTRLAAIIDPEFAGVVAALARIVEADGCRPGHVAYLSKIDVANLARAALAKLETPS